MQQAAQVWGRQRKGLKNRWVDNILAQLFLFASELKSKGWK